MVEISQKFVPFSEYMNFTIDAMTQRGVGGLNARLTQVLGDQKLQREREK